MCRKWKGPPLRHLCFKGDSLYLWLQNKFHWVHWTLSHTLSSQMSSRGEYISVISNPIPKKTSNLHQNLITNYFFHFVLILLWGIDLHQNLRTNSFFDFLYNFSGETLWECGGVHWRIYLSHYASDHQEGYSKRVMNQFPINLFKNLIKKYLFTFFLHFSDWRNS